MKAQECGSFLELEEWIVSNLPYRFAEFREIEFGPTDNVFAQSWTARLILYSVDSPFEDQLQRDFSGTDIELTPQGYWRGHNWVWNCRAILLADDFHVMNVMRIMTE